VAADASPAKGPEASPKITLRGAVFIGIGSMVGAGIFALFGQAGAITGAAVWVSFLFGGIIAHYKATPSQSLEPAIPRPAARLIGSCGALARVCLRAVQL
jgi:hypothetical protein